MPRALASGSSMRRVTAAKASAADRSAPSLVRGATTQTSVAECRQRRRDPRHSQHREAGRGDRPAGRREGGRSPARSPGDGGRAIPASDPPVPRRPAPAQPWHPLEGKQEQRQARGRNVHAKGERKSVAAHRIGDQRETGPDEDHAVSADAQAQDGGDELGEAPSALRMCCSHAGHPRPPVQAAAMRQPPP